MGMTSNLETGDTLKVTPKFLTGDFWLDFVVKQGIPAGIALYLVYNMSVRQENAIQRLNDNITALSIKIEGMRVK